MEILGNIQLPKFEDLSLYWKNYFQEVDLAIQENFWGNLFSLKLAEKYQDPYIQQLKAMGFCFIDQKEHCASFYQSLQWVFNSLNQFLKDGILSAEDILWPAKVFEIKQKTGKMEYIFLPIGGDKPEEAIEAHILQPKIVVEMAAKGFFGMGTSLRAHTNQTIAEHDLAHFGGFISSPLYMKSIRKAFQVIHEKSKIKPKIKQALEQFNSAYSLRLYYLLEVLTLVPNHQKNTLQSLLELPIDEFLALQHIIAFLQHKAKDPIQFYQYLYRLYEKFPSLVEPLGGESRDILNRCRKFNRGKNIRITSKFEQCSIYSLFQHGMVALESKRSTHSDYLRAIEEIHAPFIAALIGISQLTIEDWISSSVTEESMPDSALSQFICGSGIWNTDHIIFWAYNTKEYTACAEEPAFY